MFSIAKSLLLHLIFGLIVFTLFPSIVSAQKLPCGGPLVSGSEINGRVLFDYNGMLFTVKNAEVNVYLFDPKLQVSRGVVGAVTDDKGRFSLKGIRPGNYSIDVTSALLNRNSVKLTAVPMSKAIPKDDLVEFVLTPEGLYRCGEGYARTVKAFDDKNVFGGSASNDADQITEISLEHTGCFGTCPIFKVTLFRDGRSEYVGKEYAARPGTYHAKSDDYQFKQLAELIFRSGFFNMSDKYSAPMTDQDTMLVTIVRNDVKKTVVNYGDAAPVELWGIGMSIEAVVEKMRWAKK